MLIAEACAGQEKLLLLKVFHESQLPDILLFLCGKGGLND